LIVACRWPLKIALCDQVIVIPEDNKIAVFNEGNAQGSRGTTATGGQISPIYIDIIKAL
jgi:hypothetical protein